MVSLILLVLQMLSLLRLASGASIISMPNCADHCGVVHIPYPFGIGANCYHDSSYEIICNTSFGSPKPFLRQLSLEVLNIEWPGRHSRRETGYKFEYAAEILSVAMPPPSLCGMEDSKIFRRDDLKDSPYRFSTRFNVLMMEGCGGSAILKDRNRDTLAGCASICDEVDVNLNRTTCYGDGCCQASIEPSSGIDYYEIDVGFQQEMKKYSCNASVALVDTESMNNIGGSSSSSKSFPTTLEWHARWVSDIPYHTGINVSCEYFSCKCPFPYEGNPYLPNGCQVVEECHKCKSRCDIQYNSDLSRYFFVCKKHLLLRRASFLGKYIKYNLPVCFFIYLFASSFSTKTRAYFPLSNGSKNCHF